MSVPTYYVCPHLLCLLPHSAPSLIFSSASKMEPRSGNISCNNIHPPTRCLSFVSPESRLLHIGKSPNLRDKLMGASQTSYSRKSDICQCNICPGDDFLYPIFLNQNSFGPNIFLDPKCFVIQHFLVRKFSLAQNVFGPKIFVGPKFF